MRMIKVDSSNIDQIGFEKSKQISMGAKPINSLSIYFKNGRSYRYFDVPEELFEEFIKAKSKGKFFHKYISKRYEYELVK